MPDDVSLTVEKVVSPARRTAAEAKQLAVELRALGCCHMADILESYAFTCLAMELPTYILRELTKDVPQNTKETKR